MSEHPDRKALEGVLLGATSARESKAAVEHLLAGCETCQQELQPLAQAMFRPADSPQLTRDEDAAYDDAISKAFAFVLSQQRRMVDERSVARETVATLVAQLVAGQEPNLRPAATTGLCEALIERGLELRGIDHVTMMRLMELARDVADRLDPTVYGERRTIDFQARTVAELANVYRLNDDLTTAEELADQALEIRRQGSGDALLYSRIADVAAAIYCAQRRFRESFRMLDLSQAVFRRRGDRHELGRVLIVRGLYTGMAGQPEDALRLLARGLTMINRERDPKLVCYALHNILMFRVDLGEFEEARRQLERMRPLYATYALPADLIRMRWLEGRIAAALHATVQAERVLNEVKSDLERIGQPYHAALVALDLAAVSLELGKTVQVRELVSETVATFQALGVARETLAAVLMLHETVKREKVTLAIAQKVAGVVRRLQGPMSRADLEGV